MELRDVKWSCMGDGSVSSCDTMYGGRGENSQRCCVRGPSTRLDVMRVVTTVDLRRVTCRCGCTIMIPNDDDTNGGSTTNVGRCRRGGYVFEFSVSHCDLA